ncbi:CinA family nicotinamide mononucleotide deamidase-related protein [Deinococcus yavapaiensis]|uniref:CinA-like protein n=1 Tax=Deinococcus yavapaiensis KR-236 TaxID=694435 RepID=A0A318SP36_9DEIO|nr:CinA family nicotinamide mononucleotide deamidase-related protein [Deinococcus yavapaiensis]PYE54510.1 competence/damage-inducible protein cinA [Deinococcus yavapaiensis KR-236]
MVTLIAEIISVGTELLLGEIVDTNAAFLASELKNRGVTLYHKSVVGDNLGRVIETLRLALSRSDLVILGGGLGPTDDDLTREAISAAIGETPIVDDATLAHIRALFESRGRTFPDSNAKQAWRTSSTELLSNPIGTAPGWFVRKDGKLIVALPGPPREMKRMWAEQVLPRLPLPSRALWSTTLHTWGIGESHVAEHLGELTLQANPSVATYARRHGVDVRVAASAATSEEARALAVPVLATVEGKLSHFVYGRDDETLAGVVTEGLFSRGETVTSIEGGTGLLADLLSDARSEAYVGGAVLPAFEATEEEAAALAAQGRERATWCVVSLPSEARNLIAVSGPTFERTSSFEWPTDRRTGSERAAYGALALLLRGLLRAEDA